MKKKKRTAWNAIEWTDEMVQFLRGNWETMTNRELADHLGLKPTVVRLKLYSMGIKRMKMEYWTDEQVQFLKDNYQTIGDTELADIFDLKWYKEKGWSKKHIEKKRRYLKLKRTPEQRAAIREGGRQKGLYKESVRKMLAMRGVAPEGEIKWWRTGANGRVYAHIKIDGKYVQYPRYRWIQLHGKIDPGMNVVLKDQDPYNIEDDNMILVSDAELALINSASINLTDNYVVGVMTHNQPELREEIKKQPEIIELKRLQLKLNREINKKEKNGEK